MVSSLYGCAQIDTDIYGTYDRGQHGDPQGFADLFVLKDHTFILVFFGGGVVGTWKMEKDQVIFTPTVAPQTFALYGRHNPDLTDSTRIALMAFNDDDTFISLGKKHGAHDVMKRVFNPDANCVDFPNLMKFKGMQSQIAFTNRPYQREGAPALLQDTYIFSNSSGYNDFIAYYYTPARSYRPFKAEVKKGGLQFAGDEITLKKPLPTKKEDLEMLNSFQHIELSPQEVQFNPYYGSYEQGDVKKDNRNYTYNKKKNAWISPLNYTEGEEHKKGDNAFNQTNIIYVFDAIKPIKSKADFIVDEAPLFTRRCPEDK